MNWRKLVIHNLYKTALIILNSMFIAACGRVQLHPGNKPVGLIFYNEVQLTKATPDCDYIGPIISSYGRWYNYLVISNTDLVNGAIEDMYNKANEFGANVVYINNNINFLMSVTLLGQGYNCRS